MYRYRLRHARRLWGFSKLLGVYVAVFATVSVLAGRFLFGGDVAHSIRTKTAFVSREWAIECDQGWLTFGIANHAFHFPSWRTKISFSWSSSGSR
jgi:hypothetical protein